MRVTATICLRGDWDLGPEVTSEGDALRELRRMNAEALLEVIAEAVDDFRLREISIDEDDGADDP